LLYRSDVGVYGYGPAGPGAVRPHALQSTSSNGSSTTYGYDANGNLTSASAGKYRSIAYTSFNLPDSQSGITGPGTSAASSPRYTWKYDENHQRIQETRVIAGGTMAGTRTTWNLHPDAANGLGFESETEAPAAASAANPAGTQNRHYVSAGGQVVAVLVSSGALPTLGATQTAPPAIASIALVKLEYWHKDHLGIRTVASIAVAVYLGPAGAGAIFESGLANAAVAGFASGAIATGTLEGAVQGSFSAVVFYGVGQAVGTAGVSGGQVLDPGRFAGAIALHAVAGCVTSVAGGGKCGPGALSAAFSKAATPWTVPLGEDNLIAGTIVSSVVGGTASVLGGGKFANGAQTAAFSYLFNAKSHPAATHNEVVDWAAGRMQEMMPTDLVATHRQIVFSDGQISEMDIVQYDAKEGFLRSNEIKTGPNGRWTQVQKSYITDLQSGNYYLKGVDGIDPTRLVRDQVRVYDYNVGVYEGFRIYRSPTTRNNFKENTNTILNNVGRGIKWMIRGFNDG